MLPTIQTASGAYFSFVDLSANLISIDTIAHALSHTCRFGGHTHAFYSVAQHSVHVANCRCVPAEDRLAALLHDAAEAYLVDVPTPLKNILPDYQALERRVEADILARFGIGDIPQSVWLADKIMLTTERRDLMPKGGDEYWARYTDVEPLRMTIVPWTPEYAKRRFLELYRKLEQAQADRSAA